MASEMKEAIHQLIEKGYSEDSVVNIIQNMIKAAYKKRFNTVENCIISIADDFSDVSVYQRKVIVDGVYDPNTEIEL